MNIDSIIKQVYQNAHANVFLASFMPFIHRWKSAELIQAWLRAGFQHFLDNQVLCYNGVKDLPIHFVGSVAKYFETELWDVLQANELQPGQIVKKPAKSLAHFILDRHE